ncbi:MAG: LysR family transcriptional regulator [Rudaea sp.]|uniref:LysR family transcriptional regulator n=1 Tax=unclassified Rudaea TaxID=2627037 RepID=UPI0010F569AC|nr:MULTISPECIES: LysR family transcriptional regulator [unclassified Rudaea]MBN8886588.1 LysR family transcriptional regulator [Rudaea sp.]MBR0347667.1 LysR family transcriptional regulator [Rudaea sp.]
MDRMTALLVFRTVVSLGSFTAAAKQLRLSPAAVSKNIGELEAHLRARLLNRTTRRLSLTEAGTHYYERISRVLDDLDEADGSVGELQQRPTGHLRVSAPITLTLLTISQSVPRFLERHPGISLDLRLDDRRVDLIRDGYDCALRGSDKLEDSRLVARKLMVLKHVLCASPAYFRRFGTPENPADLLQHTCVQFTLSDHSAVWAFRKHGETVSIPVDARYKVSSSLAVRDALLAGFGLSLIPELYVRRQLAEGALVPVLADWQGDETAIYAVYPSRHFLPAKIKVFLNFLVAELGEGEPEASPATAFAALPA